MNSEIIEQQIQLLGLKAKDKVTRFEGVITTMSYDLYGCVQVVITPEYDSKTNTQGEGRWFDVTRLDVSNKRVMDVPDYENGYVLSGQKGCAEKPLP